MSIETTLARVAEIRQAIAEPAQLIAARASLAGEAQGVAAAASETQPAGAGAAPGGPSAFAAALSQASAGYAGSSSGAAGYASPGATGAGYATPGGAGLAPGMVNASASYPAGYGYPYSPVGLQGVQGIAPAATAGSPGARIVAVAESQIGQSEQPPGSNESPAIAAYRSATAGAIPGAPWCAYFASWAARQAGEPIGANGQGLGSVGEISSWAQSTGRAIPNGPGVVPAPGDLIVFGDEHVGIVRAVLPGGQIETIEGNYENKVAANVRSPTEATGYVNMG